MSELHPASHPTLKVFLSADIVGSTALKQPTHGGQSGSVDERQNWAGIIQGFYYDFAQELDRAWRELSGALSIALPTDDTPEFHPYIGRPPTFWKTVGDEVLFWKDLRNDFNLFFTLCAWRDALKICRRDLRDKAEKGVALDIKCSAWVAGFPLRNKAIFRRPIDPRNLTRLPGNIEDDDYDEVTDNIDFIGPAIDIGFRLSQWASAKKFCLSIDLVYLLSLVGTRDRYKDMIEQIKARGSPKGSDIVDKLESIKLVFDGTSPLKGVLGGLGYPRFWLPGDRLETLEDLEDDLQRSDKALGQSFTLIKKYCNKFYDDRSRFIMRPFINDPASETIGNITSEYRGLLKRFDKQIKDSAKVVKLPTAVPPA